VTCEKIACPAGRPRYRSENRSVIAGCRIYRRRPRVRAPRSTSDNRRFPAAPRTTSRPLPDRARAAAPTAQKKCTGHVRVRTCMHVYACYVCTGTVRASAHRPPRHEETRDMIADAYIYSHVHTYIDWLPLVYSLAARRTVHREHRHKCNGTTSSTTTRTATNDFVPPLHAVIFSRPRRARSSPSEKCLPCTIDAHRPLSLRPCRLYVCTAWKLSLSRRRPSSNCSR